MVAAYEFTGMRRLVDVGGGRCVLLSAILRAAPGLCGLLMDRAAAIPETRRRLDADGLGDRAECLAGDFFAGVPAGADALPGVVMPSMRMSCLSCSSRAGCARCPLG